MRLGTPSISFYLASYSPLPQVEDALALVRLDDLFIDSFQIQDVKTLKGDHLAR